GRDRLPAESESPPRRPRPDGSGAPSARRSGAPGVKPAGGPSAARYGEGSRSSGKTVGSASKKAWPDRGQREDRSAGGSRQRDASGRPGAQRRADGTGPPGADRRDGRSGSAAARGRDDRPAARRP